MIWLFAAVIAKRTYLKESWSFESFGSAEFFFTDSIPLRHDALLA